MPAFTVIDHTEIGSGGAATWSETGISSSYDHLYLWASVRSERAHLTEQTPIRLNGSSSTSDYSGSRIKSEGGTDIGANSLNTGDSGHFLWPTSCGATSLADTFATWTMWIPNYSNTVGFKQVIIQAASENNSTTSAHTEMNFIAGLFHSTSAIDEIEIFCLNGADIAEYSTFTLYGITGV